MTQRCRPMDVEYASQFFTTSISKNLGSLEISPIEFVCLPDPVFLATIRAYPLEGIALIDQGGEEEREVGRARVPDDVWAASYAMLLGFDVEDYLDLSEEYRGTFLDVEPEVTRREIAELEPNQLEEYIGLMATGVRRREALAQVTAAESESAA